VTVVTLYHSAGCHREWLPVVEIGGERSFVYYVDPIALRRKVAKVSGGG
jgi:hypothetical protein